MADFAVAKTVKTRKPHKCEMCGILIPKGDTAEVQTGCFEGHMYYYHLCDVCTEFIKFNRQNIDFDDGLDYIYDMMREQFEDEKCRKCQKWDGEAGECSVEPCPENHCRCAEFVKKEREQNG